MYNVSILTSESTILTTHEHNPLHRDVILGKKSGDFMSSKKAF